MTTEIHEIFFCQTMLAMIGGQTAKSRTVIWAWVAMFFACITMWAVS